MNKLFKLAAVAVSTSLLLFGCSTGSGVIGVNTATASDSQKDPVKEESSTIMKDTARMGNAAIDVASLTLNDTIHINQIGYREKDSKQINVNAAAKQFVVVDRSSGVQVFEGKLKKGMADRSSGDNLYYGDFTGLNKPGIYFAAIPGVGISGDFRIGSNVYGDLKNALLKSFYYQRCGMDLEEQYAGVWAHPACHTTKGSVYGQDGTELDGNGGWHDAGDYGKYTVAAATALADLMMAWELFPHSFADKVNIPANGSNNPDILNEVRYELEWILKMQDIKTGGVYHKLTTKTFPSLSIMPQDDMARLYFSPVSSTATGDFAAVTAMASRVFDTYDPKFANTCLTASEKAWIWLEQNQSRGGFRNPGEISTGEYGDENDSDERFWAAAELYRATGRPTYGNYAKAVFKNGSTGGYSFGWQSVDGFACAAYMNTDQNLQDAAVYSFLKKELLNAANKKLTASRKSGYLITLSDKDFIWGSNMALMNDARLLILADMLEPSKGYRDIAKNNLNYLLGNNPLNQCYVTGFGTKPVMDPHHRPSKADSAELPVPGLVAGGPNAGLQDDFAKINLKGKAPARCYIDYSGSYSTNETAIYWNSPAVFVTAYFCEK